MSLAASNAVNGIKTCKPCGRSLPNTTEYFSKNVRYKDGLQYICRECANQKNREYRKSAPPEKYLTSYKAKARLEQGLCYYCNEPRLLEDNTLCFEHWFQARSGSNLGTRKRWRELLELAERQEWKCALTGEVLVPGVNMSVDHKLARSTHPELIHDISNIQWITIEANFAKRELSVEQFVELCRSVVNHIDSGR